MKKGVDAPFRKRDYVSIPQAWELTDRDQITFLAYLR